MTKLLKYLLPALMLFALAACDDSKSDKFWAPATISAENDNLSFGMTKERLTLPVIIKNIGTEPLEISSVQITNLDKNNAFAIATDNCSITKTLYSYATCDVFISFTPPENSGAIQTGVLTVNSNDAATKNFKINLSGFNDTKWNPLSFGAEVPEPRYSHSLAAREAEMYLFGGTDGINYFNDIWVMNIKEEWKKVSLSTSAQPAARSDASLININSNLLLFGGKSKGIGGSDIHYTDIWVYKPFSTSWEEVKSIGGIAPDADTTSLSKAVSIDNTLYFISPAESATETITIYSIDISPVNKTWVKIYPVNAPKLTGNLKANTVIGNKIYIYGADDIWEGLWVFDTKTNIFSKVEFSKNASLPFVGYSNVYSAAVNGGFNLLFSNKNNNGEMWNYSQVLGFTKSANNGWAGLIEDYSVVMFNKQLYRFGGRTVTADGSVNNTPALLFK